MWGRLFLVRGTQSGIQFAASLFDRIPRDRVAVFVSGVRTRAEAAAVAAAAEARRAEPV